MKYLELCPVCIRTAKQLVDRALDFTASVTQGEFPRICAPHLPLVFSALSYGTMATWLDRTLEEQWTVNDAEGVCSLCEIEARVTITTPEAASAFLCTAHGGPSPDTVDAIRWNPARIAAGERFDHQGFIIRAALIFYASIRGTTPMVRIE